jgi:hypothetical protein
MLAVCITVPRRPSLSGDRRAIRAADRRPRLNDPTAFTVIALANSSRGCGRWVAIPSSSTLRERVFLAGANPAQFTDTLTGGSYDNMWGGEENGTVRRGGAGAAGARGSTDGEG